MKSDKLYCVQCDSEQGYMLIEKSGQKTAWCEVCKSYIKNIAYSEPAFFFGKYKGKLIADIHDPQYMKWFVINIKGNKSTKAAIEKKLYG